jgi:cysteine-rich secretory family protein
MPVSRVVLASVLAVVGLLGLFEPRLAAGASLDSAEQDLVARINVFRAARGLPTLTVSDTLTAAAKWMSVDMGSRNYFAHTSLDGRSPTQRMADAGYPAFGTWTGEDLAAGYTTTGDVLNGWINSPGHYAVLVNPQYHAIGVGRGYSAGSSYGWYWAADFGGVIDVALASQPLPRRRRPRGSCRRSRRPPKSRFRRTRAITHAGAGRVPIRSSPSVI